MKTTAINNNINKYLIECYTVNRKKKKKKCITYLIV